MQLFLISWGVCFNAFVCNCVLLIVKLEELISSPPKKQIFMFQTNLQSFTLFLLSPLAPTYWSSLFYNKSGKFLVFVGRKDTARTRGSVCLPYFSPACLSSFLHHKVAFVSTTYCKLLSFKIVCGNCKSSI